MCCTCVDILVDGENRYAGLLINTSGNSSMSSSFSLAITLITSTSVAENAKSTKDII